MKIVFTVAQNSLENGINLVETALFLLWILGRLKYNFFKAWIDFPVETRVPSKVNFKLHIRQNFFLKEIGTSRVCVVLKTILSSGTLTNIKLK